MEKMTRGEVAKRAGVSRETVRYYEERGLLPAPLVRQPVIASTLTSTSSVSDS